MNDKLEIEDSLSISAFSPSIWWKDGLKNTLKMYLKVTKGHPWERLASVRVKEESSCPTLKKIINSLIMCQVSTLIYIKDSQNIQSQAREIRLIGQLNITLRIYWYAGRKY